MRKFIIITIFLLTPLTAFAVPEKKEQREKLGIEFKLPCWEYGEESCIARFLAMEACTFVFGVNSGKPPQEAMNIASDMFVLIMQGNKLKLSDMYNQSGKIKPEIKSEAYERIAYCRDATKEALPKLYKAQKGEDPSPEMVEGLTATFGQWYLKTIEDVGVGKEKKKEVF